ncbi:MAG: sortase related acyltransferase [halophilic archaeon J07HX5]|jgi:Sortase and related acyltransferases|nr:MAG: sortase related acyltransferase [halophilic archaeon J07HX5]
MAVSIRVATPNDAERIRDVHLRSIEELGGQAYSETQVEAWAHDRDPGEYPIETETTHVLVAEDDAVLGFGWLRYDAGEHLQALVDGEIVAVYVHPSAARRGVGSQLYSALEAEADRRGLELLGLWASLNAVPFYKTHGYDRVTDHALELRAGVELTVTELRKRLFP